MSHPVRLVAMFSALSVVAASLLAVSLGRLLSDPSPASAWATQPGNYVAIVESASLDAFANYDGGSSYSSVDWPIRYWFTGSAHVDRADVLLADAEFLRLPLEMQCDSEGHVCREASTVLDVRDSSSPGLLHRAIGVAAGWITEFPNGRLPSERPNPK